MNDLDRVFETLSELKIRVSKLEQYAKLLDEAKKAPALDESKLRNIPFEQAIVHMKNGRTILRPKTGAKIHKGTLISYLSMESILAEDWEVVL